MSDSQTNVRLVVNLGTQQEIRTNAVSRAQSIRSLVLAGDPSQTGSKFDILVDAMIERAAELLSVI
jgi:hypothetical protein